MKKALTILLIGILSVTILMSLCGCGDSTGKEKETAPVASGDAPEQTLPETEPTESETVSETVPLTSTGLSEEVTTTDEAVEPAVTTVAEHEQAPATTTVTQPAEKPTEASSVTTNVSQAATTAATTTVTTAATTVKTTEAAPVASSEEEPVEEEEEDVGWEIIENLDEWLASMGFDTGVVGGE